MKNRLQVSVLLAGCALLQVIAEGQTPPATSPLTATPIPTAGPGLVGPVDLAARGARDSQDAAGSKDDAEGFCRQD